MTGARDPGRPRKELTAAVAGAVLAGALALSAGGRAWATVTADRRPPLPPVEGTVTGADAVPLVPSAGLVLLAAAVALLAVRGVGRVAVGLLTAVAGGALAVSAVRALTGAVEDAAADLPGLDRITGTDLSVAWPVLTLVAAVLAVGTGLLVVLRGRGWPAMGRKYERPAAGAATGAPGRPTPTTDEDRAQAAWQALDRGEDPTA